MWPGEECPLTGCPISNAAAGDFAGATGGLFTAAGRLPWGRGHTVRRYAAFLCRAGKAQPFPARRRFARGREEHSAKEPSYLRRRSGAREGMGLPVDGVRGRCHRDFAVCLRPDHQRRPASFGPDGVPPPRCRGEQRRELCCRKIVVPRSFVTRKREGQREAGEERRSCRSNEGT